jgi:hypothetical protein
MAQKVYEEEPAKAEAGQRTQGAANLVANQREGPKGAKSQSGYEASEQAD